MPLPPVLLLGCGATLTRVAHTLLDRGRSVIATSRDPRRLAALAARGAVVVACDATRPDQVETLTLRVPHGSLAAHSVPVLEGPGGPEDPTPRLLDRLAPRLSRLVYLSSTGVYGTRTEVDERTPAEPATLRQQLRLDAEGVVATRVSSSVALRPAAIYGPDRGVHVLLREGRYALVGDGSNVVSRIHVDDLASHVVAALDSDLRGAWPVADREAATAAEVARFVCDLLGVPFPPSVAPEAVHETRRVTRRVDGRAVRRALGIELAYPTYREGIRAALSRPTG